MKKWKNTIKKHFAYPSKIIKVKSLADVIKSVKSSEEKGLPIRAVGSGHSFSDVAIVPKGGILLDFRKVNQFKLHRNSIIRSEFHQTNLVEVGGGLTIRDLNKRLDKENLAVLNMGGIDHQTISGVISTGTHGTGVNLPAMTGMVRSILLVAAEGKVYRIEPENGITDPIAYDEKGIELIQDNDVFNSVLVSMGCMGIMYSLILEVEDMYWLKETKTMYDWNDIRPLILNKKIHQGENLRAVMVILNPYIFKGKRKCIVVKHYNIEEPNKRSINEATRNILPSLASNPLVYAYLMWRINRKPQNAPGRINSALITQKDKVFINRAHKVLFQGVEFLKERAYDCEFAFNLNETSYLNALDEIFEVADRFKGINLYQTSPIGIRFVKRSNAYLTPEYNRDVCYFDTPFLIKSKGADIMLDEYQEIMLKHGGIPHWGKINTVLDKQPEIINNFYPKFNVWKENMDRFNPKRYFSNEFTKRLKLDNSKAKTMII